MSRYYSNQSTLASRLADIAHEKSFKIYEERTKTEKADQVIFYDIFNEQFAELIVRECAKIASNPAPGCHSSFGQIILKHFGVE